MEIIRESRKIGDDPHRRGKPDCPFRITGEHRHVVTGTNQCCNETSPDETGAAGNQYRLSSGQRVRQGARRPLAQPRVAGGREQVPHAAQRDARCRDRQQDRNNSVVLNRNGRRQECLIDQPRQQHGQQRAIVEGQQRMEHPLTRGQRTDAIFFDKVPQGDAHLDCEHGDQQ